MRPVLLVVPVFALVFLTACNQGPETGQASETTTTVSNAPTSIPTTTMPTTTAPTTTAQPYDWPLVDDAHAYAYESGGYSCGAEPSAGCEGDAIFTLVEVGLHKEDGSTTADCLDIMMKAHDSNVLHRVGYMGPADSPELVGTGWGIRLVQLDSPPVGLDIGGEAWLELTVSSLTAIDFASRTPAVPTTMEYVSEWFGAPTDTDPVSIRPSPGTANVVEELILIDTTDDMMQWIVALNDDHVYHHYSSYGRWGIGATALTIKINGGDAS